MNCSQQGQARGQETVVAIKVKGNDGLGQGESRRVIRQGLGYEDRVRDEDFMGFSLIN